MLMTGLRPKATNTKREAIEPLDEHNSFLTSSGMKTHQNEQQGEGKNKCLLRSTHSAQLHKQVNCEGGLWSRKAQSLNAGEMGGNLF